MLTDFEHSSLDSFNLQPKLRKSPGWRFSQWFESHVVLSIKQGEFPFDFNCYKLLSPTLPLLLNATEAAARKVIEFRAPETSTFKNFHLYSFEKKGMLKLIVSSPLPFKFRITKKKKLK